MTAGTGGSSKAPRAPVPPSPGSLELRKVREEVEPGESWPSALGWRGRRDQGDFRKGPLARLPGSGQAMQVELVPAWTLGCMVLGICT